MFIVAFSCCDCLDNCFALFGCFWFGWWICCCALLAYCVVLGLFVVLVDLGFYICIWCCIGTWFVGCFGDFLFTWMFCLITVGFLFDWCLLFLGCIAFVWIVDLVWMLVVVAVAVSWLLCGCLIGCLWLVTCRLLWFALNVLAL